FTSACTTWCTVPSPPAATNNRCPSAVRARTSAAMSVSDVRRTTSSPISPAAETSASASLSARRIPDEVLKNSNPFGVGNFRLREWRSVDLMKRLAFLISVLPFLVLPLRAADAPKDCSLCVGAVSDLTVAPATPVPLLVRVGENDLATAGAAFDTFSPEQRRKTTVIVSYAFDKSADPLQEVEKHTKAIVDWARTRGPFQSFGVSFDAPSAEVAEYAIKRLAVSAQGLNVAGRIVAEGQGPSAYYDEILVPASRVAETLKWIAENDPSKKIIATVDAQSPNAFFDLAQALANGATRAYLTRGADVPSAQDDFAALANFNLMLAGDWAYDST